MTMLSTKWRKIVQYVLSFVLLLSVTVLYGPQTVDAAQTGIGSRVVKIAARESNSMALKSDGTVVAWEYNYFGQTNVPAGLNGVVSIAVGRSHSLALKSDGTVIAWGYNYFGQSNVPTGLNGVVSIAAGENHSLALKSDGTVVAWGYNYYGQTNVPAGLTGVVSIAAGGNHSLVLKSDGTVVAWGLNARGETNVPAGLNGVVSITAGDHHSLALKSDGTVVAWGGNGTGQTNVPAGLNGVVSIDAGGLHSLALKSDGTVVGWGYNGLGQTNVPAGLTGVVSIAAGGNHSLALKSDGAVVAWGRNFDGETNVPAGLTSPVKGSGIAAGRDHSLVLKSDGTVVAWGSNGSGQTNVPAGLTGVASIAAGTHSLAMKSDGTVAAWGNNDYGQTNVPVGLTGVISIAAGVSHSLALKSNGTVVAWGKNDFGQANVPAGLTGVVSIAAGYLHSLAMKSDGTVVVWGSNDFDQTNVPVGLTGVVSIAAGGYHSLAMKSDGTVVAWGYPGSQTNVPSGLTGVVSIAAGGSHSLALKSDGTVVAWGSNGSGQTNVPSGLTGVVSITAGWTHSLALKSDGTVVAWGDNTEGQTNVPGNNNLNGLALQEGSFDTSFSPSVTSYTYSYIGSSVSSVNVTAELADTAYAALYVNDQPQVSGSTATVNVAGASTVIPVRVEPYFKAAKTYTITVLRDSTLPVIQFDVNGNASPAKTAASKVTVTDMESGVDAASLQYAWTQSTAVPSGGWRDFPNGETPEQKSGDGNWYLHVRASDRTGNLTEAVSNVFILDNTPPTVAVSSSTGGTVNDAFPITIAFNEPVNGFSEGAIEVGNGMVSNLVRNSAASYTATITPTTSGQAVTVRVAANAATDEAGNGNEASEIMSFLYDITKPVVSFGGFTDHQRFVVPPSSVSVTVSEAVYWTANGAELNASNALPLLSMDQDGATFSAYTASYNEETRTYTLTFDGSLGDGAYKVNVAGDVVENVYHNTLDAASASFTVAVPFVTGISADPTRFTSAGGSAAVAITGFNLTGQTVRVYADGTATATANVISDTSAAATVTLPPNTTSSDKTYVLTVDLNGVEVVGPSAVLTVVARAASSSNSGGSTSAVVKPKPAIDLNGTPLNPDTLDTMKPSVTLEVTPNLNGTAYVGIPASILTGFSDTNASLMLEIKTPYGSYIIPVHLASLIPGLNDLLAANNLNAEDISFKITLTDKSANKEIKAALASSLPQSEVLGTIVDFNMEIVNTKTGQSIGTANRFSKALTRIIPLPKNITQLPEQWGAFRSNDKNMKFEFVPARAVQIDGTWYAMISSYSNSVYVAIQNSVSFTDMQNHWGQSFVRLAAAKGLVEGVGGGKYQPNQSVTRAEFTAMVVRALGRGTSANSSSVPYGDVQSGAWYFNAVAQAKELGLLGFANSKSFMPDQPLTREEMASMLAAVIKLEKLPVTGEFVSLNGYKDIGSVDEALLQDVRIMVKLEVMTGTSTHTFGPKGNTTRAQAAAVLIRMLQALGF